MHDATGSNSHNPKTDVDNIIIIDMVSELESMQDFCSRVEKTGGKMTATQLAGFKAELTKFESNAAKIENQTQSLTGSALKNCWNACKSVWPSWWQTIQSVACCTDCLLI